MSDTKSEDPFASGETAASGDDISDGDVSETIVGEEGLMQAARQARANAGLTQEEAARRLEVDQSTISQAERSAGRNLTRLRRRMVEELSEGDWAVEGALYRIRKKR